MLPIATAKAIIKSTGDGDLRCGEDAAKKVAEFSTTYLKKAGKKAAKLVELSKGKGVTFKDERLYEVLSVDCAGLSADVISGLSKSKNDKAFAVAPCVRFFKTANSELRVGKDSQEILSRAATAYARAIAERAIMIAKNAKRTTVQAEDVKMAHQLIHMSA